MDAKKQELIKKYYDNEHLLFQATREQKETYKAYVEEGVQKDWIIALYAKGYGCYGGNDIFECDWVVSRDCFLRIIELQGDVDPFVYNSLGYIYYYGRCNENQPEYDLAFKYFSVGAASGVFESMYKMADMFIAGKGVPKSERAGAKLILEIYEENKNLFCNNDTGCKFADVALRVGGLYERGCGVKQDYEAAYYHYLEASLAIELRMMDMDYYGDSKVKRNILEALDRVKDQLPEDYFKDAVEFVNPRLIGYMLNESVGLDVELTKKGGHYYLIANRYASKDFVEDMLINVPQVGYCQLVNSIKLRLVGFEPVDDLKLPQKAFINSIAKGEHKNSWVFSFRDMPMFEISCDKFVFDGDRKIR